MGIDLKLIIIIASAVVFFILGLFISQKPLIRKILGISLWLLYGYFLLVLDLERSHIYIILVLGAIIGLISNEIYLDIKKSRGKRASAKHQNLIESANGIKVGYVRQWTTLDAAKWAIFRDCDELHNFKKQWVKGYADIIKAAAKKQDLPEYLVTVVAYAEVGGGPLWFDFVAYIARSAFDIENNENRTSFGNLSVQIGAAAKILEYDPENLTAKQKISIIKSLYNPIQNIFIAAAHLSDLRNIYFIGKGASDLTIDDIKIIATRYNRGPVLSIDEIKKNLDYGENS